MRILIVTPFPVFPLTHGGSVRVHRLAVGLACAGETVDVMCPWYRGQPPRRFRREGVTWHPHLFFANVLPLVLPERLMPALVSLSWQPSRPGPRRRLREFCGVDVVQFEFPTNFAWRKLFDPGPKFVYSAHNVERDYFSERAAGPLRDSIVRRVESIEGAAVRDSDLVLACTRADAERLSTLYGDAPAIEVIPTPHGEELADSERERLRESFRERLGIDPGDRVLLFLGGRAPHNQQALAALEEDVLPKLRAPATLLVAGRCSESRPARRDERVHRLGYVDDLRPVLAATDIALNPVTLGSGSPVKLADYLAAGLQVLSTPIGGRGFEQFGDSVHIATLDEFPAMIDSLTLSSASAPMGLEELSIAGVGKRLLEIYERLGSEVPRVRTRTPSKRRS